MPTSLNLKLKVKTKVLSFKTIVSKPPARGYSGQGDHQQGPRGPHHDGDGDTQGQGGEDSERARRRRGQGSYISCQCSLLKPALLLIDLSFQRQKISDQQTCHRATGSTMSMSSMALTTARSRRAFSPPTTRALTKQSSRRPLARPSLTSSLSSLITTRLFQVSQIFCESTTSFSSHVPFVAGDI